MSYIEPGLFDLPAVPATTAPRSLAQVARDLRPTWAAHTGTHAPCQECVEELHRASGVGPLPRAARLVRTVKATSERRLLCDPHGRALREADDQANARKASRR